MVRDAREPYGAGELRFEQTPSLDPLVRRCPEADDGERHDLSTATDTNCTDGRRVLVARTKCSCGWEDERLV
ncbi:hypothetical protein C448_03038 [Halococcus morrhuae DSM 1307]|uniref:Uncharacterized protein n=2 Tax=Halococcus TaxID=2249 RepID=M0MWJ3_HALMO|nr:MULTISPECIES: hypothetical protein [Halococcus]EMA48810.1 hypothetical protein C448_03038 [Halococcus morrhuae DSM 1307]UOO95442.1 hypothetical protein MUK72_01730 [Halococcus dombrowskii]